MQKFQTVEEWANENRYLESTCERVDLPKESLNYVDRLRMRELTNIELKKLEGIDDLSK